MSSQFHAPDLCNEVRDAVEAFERAMCEIAEKAGKANRFLDQSAWRRSLAGYAEDFLSSKGDFISAIEEADEALREREAA